MDVESNILSFASRFLRNGAANVDMNSNCTLMLAGSSEFQNLSHGHLLTTTEVASMGNIVWNFVLGNELSIKLDTSFPFEQYGSEVTGETLAHVFSSELLSEYENLQKPSTEGLELWFCAVLFHYRHCLNKDIFFSGSRLFKIANAVARSDAVLSPNLERVICQEFQAMLIAVETS